MLEEFKLRATAVGAEVHEFKTNEDALSFIQNFLQEMNVDKKDGFRAGRAVLQAIFLDAGVQGRQGRVCVLFSVCLLCLS